MPPLFGGGIFHNTTPSYKIVDQRNRPCDPSVKKVGVPTRNWIILRNFAPVKNDV